MPTYTASYARKKFQAATLPDLVQAVQAALRPTGLPDTFYVYADGVMVGMFTWDVFGSKPEFRRVPGVTGPAVDTAQAELLDAERDAYHAAQDALEQVWLGEVYAEEEADPTKCTCGAVNSFYEPAHFYCVCDL